MPYLDAKVYSDGSHYIAIPSCPRPKRIKAEHKDVIVEVDTNEEQIEEETDYSWLADCIPIEDDYLPFPEDDVQVKKKKVNLTEMFENLYQESMFMKRNAKKQYIKNAMNEYFNDEEKLDEFVETNLQRKWTNLITRKVRMMRKINLQEFNYFCTFTYDAKKINEQDFREKLLNTFRHLHTRKGWKYIGVWEHGSDTDRLHFHGLFYIPNGTMPGTLEEVNSYSFSTHKRQITNQNTYFNDRFGRNDFSIIDVDYRLGNAMKYLVKYIEKSGERIVYSRGLPTYFKTDILDEDVICPFGTGDKKLILFDNFTCVNEGEIIGTVSKEVIEQMPKAQ